MSSHSHTDAFEPPRVAREVSDGIFAYVQPDGSWWINNTGFLVGSRGVVSVDACATERRTRAYREAIAAVTDQPVRVALVTHTRPEFLFGGTAFRELGIPIRMHSRTSRLMASRCGICLKVLC